MDKTMEDDERVARLALELIVRRLAQRVTRNHPHAFVDLSKDLERLRDRPEACDAAAVMDRVAAIVGRAC